MTNTTVADFQAEQEIPKSHAVGVGTAYAFASYFTYLSDFRVLARLGDRELRYIGFTQYGISEIRREALPESGR